MLFRNILHIYISVMEYCFNACICADRVVFNFNYISVITDYCFNACILSDHVFLNFFYISVIAAIIASGPLSMTVGLIHLSFHVVSILLHFCYHFQCIYLLFLNFSTCISAIIKY